MGTLENDLRIFLKKYKEDIRGTAQQLLGEELPELTEDLFALYEKSGNRLEYEAVYFTRRKFLAVFTMAAVLEKQSGGVSGVLCARLAEIAEEVCKEECWALPAHVNRRENEDWRITIDLFASETAQTLSELWDLLQDSLPEACGKRIREEVERRVLKPFFSSEIPYQPWEHVDTNWNAVCAGSVGSACLHLLRGEPDRLHSCLDRICRALPYYISGFANDGTCLEGLSYFTYGMTYFVNFALELCDYTEGRADLLGGRPAVADEGLKATGAADQYKKIAETGRAFFYNIPDLGIAQQEWYGKIARIASFQGKCFFADGRTLSFSDGDSRDRFRMGLSAALAMRFPRALLPGRSRAAGLHDDTCYRFAALKMDLLETEKYLDFLECEPGLQKPEGRLRNDDRPSGEFMILPDAQWCIGRSKNGAGMACKGGHNAEPHNHNDIGQLLYEAEGCFFLTDLGAGEYTREYFSGERYHIFCNHSFSHSVPILDGEGQRAGAEYGSRHFSAGANATVSMELQGAYEKELACECSRSLFFELGGGALCVEDLYRFYDGKEHLAVENLVTQALPEVCEEHIVLKGHGAAAILEIEEQAGEWPPQEQEAMRRLREQTRLFGGREIRVPGMDTLHSAIMVLEFPHSNHKGLTEKVYAIRWPVLLKNNEGRSIFRIKLY